MDDLFGEDEDDEEEEEGVFTVANEYVSEAEANDGARSLVEHGIGAEVSPIPADELPEDGPSAGYQVRVLAHEQIRAQEVLGLIEPEDRPEANPVEFVPPPKRPLAWKQILVIWLIAMIVLPVVAFLLTYEIVQR